MGHEVVENGPRGIRGCATSSSSSLPKSRTSTRRRHLYWGTTSRAKMICASVLCGCGKSIDNRGRSASHRRKWASAACRQRAHAERARDARLGRRMSVCAPDDVINASRKKGRSTTSASRGAFNPHGRHGRSVIRWASASGRRCGERRLGEIPSVGRWCGRGASSSRTLMETIEH